MPAPVQKEEKTATAIITANSYVFAKKILDEVLVAKSVIKRTEIWVHNRLYVTVDTSDGSIESDIGRIERQPVPEHRTTPP